MKKCLVVFVLTIVSFITYSNYGEIRSSGTKISDLWDTLKSDEYSVLPHKRFGLFETFGWGADFLKRAAKRTFREKSDLLPPFKKLVHTNGVCLKGAWQISEDANHAATGYFKAGSHAVIIARASTAFANTKVGKPRAFGIAGKLYPTSEVDDQRYFESANFFLIDDLGGTKAKHITDVEFSNAPPTSVSGLPGNIALGLRVAATFRLVDDNPNVRQLYPISELGEKDLNKVRTPRWMMIQAQPGQSINELDFRDELDIRTHRPDGLIFDVNIAWHKEDGKRLWHKVGEIKFTDSVASKSCDTRLHFHHPKWRDNLNH